MPGIAEAYPRPATVVEGQLSRNRSYSTGCRAHVFTAVAGTVMSLAGYLFRAVRNVESDGVPAR